MKELVKGLIEKRTPEGICVLRAHYTADPERRSREWKERERRKYTSESSWQAEQEIVFGAGGGERLFADILNRYGHKILIDPETSGFQPSPDWEYFGGFDAGKANPTAALVGCIDFDGIIYILREYYQPGLSPKQHTPWLRTLQGFMGIPIYSDRSIFYANHAQNDGTFKAISLKSGVNIAGFMRIGRKLRICREIYAAVDQSFMELASGLQRFQLVNSMQDFLSPHHYEGRVG